jgi:hypothetical protein
MTKKKKIVVSKRVRALFALRELSEKLQSDVLDDPATAKLWDIRTQRNISLTPDLNVQMNSLFSIFRAAADGKNIPQLIDSNNKKHRAKASIDPHGTGILQVGKHRIRLSHVLLMSGSPKTRLHHLTRILDSLTIHRGLLDELHHIAGDRDYSVDEFVAITKTLSTSPNEFHTRLSEKASMRRIALSDILPDDHRHWDNLTAPVAASGTLTEFIANELALERGARMIRNPILAFRYIALSFSAPALVPFDLFRPLDKETKKRLLEEALLLEDHFSLVGAFELCADWISDDPDFSESGERLLDRLFSDLKRLETVCGMFAAAFVLSVAKIAQADKVNAKPAFWRRLAAASHASLVVRSCKGTEIDHKDLIEWSMRQSGHAYFLSVFSDFTTDPQWRPEWIDPSFLLADVCGRAIGAWFKIPNDKAPRSWTERIDKLRNWIHEKHYEILMPLPAVMEGARRPDLPTVSELQNTGELYEVLMREPSIEHLLRTTPAIQAFGPPREITESLYKVIGIVRADSSADDDGFLANAIKLLSHVAALLQDTGLANAVAEACIERLAIDQRRETVIEAIHRLLECSAADTDSAGARLFLSRKLEQICYTITKAELLAEAVAWIEELKLISPELKCALGRALAIAKLGALALLPPRFAN